MRCLSLDEIKKLELYGDYDCVRGSRIVLSVNICDKKNNCSGKEIDYEEWFADQYLTYIVNEKHFDLNASEEDNRIKDVSRIHHIPIPNQIKSTYQYKIRTGTFDVDSSVASVSQDP